MYTGMYVYTHMCAHVYVSACRVVFVRQTSLPPVAHANPAADRGTPAAERGSVNAADLKG